MTGYRVYSKDGAIKADISERHGKDLFARFDGEWCKTKSGKRAYELRTGAVLETLGTRLYLLEGDLIVEGN